MSINLSESEEKFRSLFETMHEGFALHEVVYDDTGAATDYRYLDVNPAFERLTGLTRSQVIGRRIREILPTIEEQWVETYARVAATGEPAELESYVPELDRHYRARAYSPERGKFAALFEDITEQKKAQLALQRREEQLRVLFESSNAGIILIDPTGMLTVANDRAGELFGVSVAELIGTQYPDLIHPDQRSIGGGKMRRLIDGKIDHVITERHYIRRDGSDFWGYFSGRRHEDSDGNLISLVGHISDITERKKAEDDLEASRRLLTDIFEFSGMLIAVKNRDGQYEMVNRKWENVTGRSRLEALGRNDEELFPYPVGQQFRQNDLEAMQGDSCLEKEEAIEDENGRLHYAISLKFPLKGRDGSVSGVCVMSTDITERRRIEEERRTFEQQLLHAQKLESLGVLAGGIAHDFNNILMAIIGNADLALMRLNRESPAVENLKRIEQAAARAADLARQMLAYSGKGKFMVENVDLNQLLEDMLHMLEVSISKKAVLRLTPGIPLPSIEVDATQMRQIIMNLVINASEAIGDRSGTIAISTGSMECDQTYLQNVWLDENLAAGLYVTLEISDTGCGMDKETLSKLFDPFFTTKFTGRGLGMAAVLGIVRSHKGVIHVYSEPGVGSSFRILLPASDHSGGGGRSEADCHKDIWLGSGKVLLVDDEESVRRIGSEMLTELGFEVITANDGREAIDIFAENPDVSFVILDLTMPHLDGEQCFRELRTIKPDVQVIMSSGYHEQEVTRKFFGKGLAGFIQKPYKLDVLREAIQKI
ncbi:MAG TPA: PAS domain S-box protein [Desulfuromonadales bacterium]|nr:PAS domain S-box protein [Desulfuromonadales bacterium]